MKDLNQIELLLNEKIPRDVVSLRDGGGGRKLSYLEGWYVIDRLNRVFGPLGWAKEILDVKEVRNTTSKGEFPAYLVKVRLTVQHAGQITVKEGYGYGADKSTQNAHELAIKEAVTDALKVAAKDLGMSMGLALYDKTQENVEELVEEQQAIPIKHLETKPTTKEVVTREDLLDAVRSYFKVAEAQKRITKEKFKHDLDVSYSKSKIDDLSSDHLLLVLNSLKDLTK